MSVLCTCALLSFTCSLILPYKHCYTQRRFRSYLRFHSNLHRKTAHNVECYCWSRSVASRPRTDQPPLATDRERSDVLELDGHKTTTVCFYSESRSNVWILVSGSKFLYNEKFNNIHFLKNFKISWKVYSLLKFESHLRLEENVNLLFI